MPSIPIALINLIDHAFAVLVMVMFEGFLEFFCNSLGIKVISGKNLSIL